VAELAVDSSSWDHGDQKIGGKNHPNLGESSQNNCQTKKYQSIFIKAKLESSNCLHHTSSKLLNYLKQMIFFTKNFSWAFKNSPNDEISPNLVTLTGI
jgi:hypothetical protein